MRGLKKRIITAKEMSEIERNTVLGTVDSFVFDRFMFILFPLLPQA